MTSRWEGYEPELRSGDSDRVNTVVDEIKQLSVWNALISLTRISRAWPICMQTMTTATFDSPEFELSSGSQQNLRVS